MAVSMQKTLLAAIDAAAKEERRTRSNYVVNALSELLKDRLHSHGDKTNDTR
jgi:metal-responsive CopG/Arc/MetJ family transcriptional regulator